jgi:phage-related tail fiber protein
MELFAQGKRVSESHIGSIFWWSLPDPPPYGLFCNGQEVSRTEYSELFEVIGTYYGAGDGETTFNLPDMRGYFVRGYDPNNVRDPEGNTRGFGTGQPATNIPYIRLYYGYLFYGASTQSYDVSYMDSWFDEGQMRVINVTNSQPNTQPRQFTSRPVNINLLPCIQFR